MKRLIPLFIWVVAWCNIHAQNQIDALRFSQTFAGGTARSVAMGGAFGALGGDFSSVSENPAGLGVYRNSELTFTPEYFYNYTSTRYNGSVKSDYKNNFNLNNLGFVSAFHKSKNKTGYVGGAFAFGFNRLNNFSNNIRIEGTNHESSLGQAYAESANNIGNGDVPDNIASLDAFTEWLFFDSWVIDTTSDGFYHLNPAMLDNGEVNVLQRNSIQQSGRINEWVFSAGFNIGYKFYFGGTFGILPLEYYENSTFSENDGNDNRREYFRFYETSTTQGTGYTGKFGIIFKPVPILRVGASVHLPTTFYLNQQWDASMRSIFIVETVYPEDEYGERIDKGVYDYRLITPAKYIASIGLTLAKSFILSTDVEYVNYASMRLTAGGDGYNFAEENQAVDAIYRSNINLKSGAEFRIKNVYLRGGFAYYGSPYNKNELNSGSNRYCYSGGLGLRNDRAFIDFAFSYMTYTEQLVLYSLPSKQNSASSKLSSSMIKSLLTVGFKF
jgi:hypothetical protein